MAQYLSDIVEEEVIKCNVCRNKSLCGGLNE